MTVDDIKAESFHPKELLEPEEAFGFMTKLVTRDIPSDVFVCGVPCQVIRKITETDNSNRKITNGSGKSKAKQAKMDLLSWDL